MFKLSKSKNLNFAEIYHKAQSVYDEIPLVKKARRRRATFKLLKYFSIFILVVFVLLSILFGSQVFSLLTVYDKSISGKYYLEQAIEKTKTQEFEQAISFSNQSTEDFNQAIEAFNEFKNGFLSSNVPYFNSQFNNVSYLLNSAEILSRSVNQGSAFANELQNLLDDNKKLTYSLFNPEEKKRIIGRLYQSAPELNGMQANLELALMDLNKIQYNGILLPAKGKIEDVKTKVRTAADLLKQAIPMSQVLPALAGYPKPSTFLVLLQNSDELRPTGGFLGTYGILETESGDINRFETHDIYHMDMPVKDLVNLDPPAPIKTYLNKKWYMRDANWSPDWPSAARQIEWFYKTENNLLPKANQINNFNGEFDGVIAITPKLVIDLISITGPIIIDGEEYNDRNFTDLLQYKVEKGYAELGTPSWQRKETIGKIVKEMKIRLLNLPASEWRSVLDTFNINLAKKNVLLYLNDPALEDIIKEQQWAGDIKYVNSDYLMVVDANMASLKTDAVMNRIIDYKVKETTAGLIATVTINYAHEGKVDWKTDRYQSYTRVYVPKGSALIKATGHANENVDIKDEFDKTSFGLYLKVDPESIADLTIEYRLPERLNSQVKNGNYGLFVQKQPGSRVENLKVDAKFINVIKSYKPFGFSVTRQVGNTINWQTDLETDKQFNIAF